MKQYNVNGTNYLAENLASKEGIMVLENAMKVGAVVNQNDVQDYMKAGNLDQLKDVTFGGAGVSFSEVDLDQEIEFAIELAGMVMAQAEKVAVKRLINAEFDAGLGKL